MRRLLGIIKIITGFLLCTGLIIGTKKIVSHLFSIDGYCCKFDRVLSQSYQNNIFNFLNANNSFRSCPLGFLSQKIKKEFSVIKDIKASQQSNGILNISFIILEPKFIVNKNYIVTQNKDIFKKDIFDAAVLSFCKNVMLENLNIENKDSLPQSCKDMIFALPQECFSDYEIARLSDTKSYMYDKQNKDFSILFSDFKVPNNKILLACKKIKKDLEQTNEFISKNNKRKRKNNKWVADIRFKDQIVIFKEIRRR